MQATSDWCQYKLYCDRVSFKVSHIGRVSVN